MVTNMEGAGLLTYSSTTHQGAINTPLELSRYIMLSC